MGLWKKLQKLMKKRDTDTPWMSSMTDKYAKPSSSPSHADGGSDGAPQPTVAAFSPNQQTAAKRGRGSSVLVYQKSPLLVATPPQVTRALAYSHPFILPLNHIAGLLSWTTGDVWESFLLLAAFWFATLYGDHIIRWAGPLVVVMGLILGMYSRRYSPLSSTLWSGEKKGKRKRPDSEPRKSLDEILETLQTFTQRCDVLLDPLLRLTEFLSTQSSATSATTRPALTSLFLRILALTPLWILLTVPPLHLVTTKRIIVALGTIGLSWHSRPARVTRAILWRSRAIRNAMSLITGLTFIGPSQRANTTSALTTQSKDSNIPTPGVAKDAQPGVRFAFSIYENQRRWLGLGWTASLLAYERQAWTDEHTNTCPDTGTFELPDTEHDTTKWRWVPGSAWKVEGATTEKERSAKRIGGGGGGDDAGWTYYDNKWHDGRKTDGWDRYTRRRKWIRDAELVDVSASDTGTATLADAEGTTSPLRATSDDGDPTSPTSTAKRKAGWFGGSASKPKPPRNTLEKAEQKQKKLELDRSDAGSGKAGSADSVRSARDDSGEDVHTPTRYREFEWDRSIGEGVMEGLS
ncbi:hypothetical protein B0A55_10472 [Friedmanniomyces simplex]|uniref:Peroxin/Ferlin domain-containing protein n=1 Tax=Friedmanniomyces simplex TaxID=329884 RepID=A0A4U0WHJ7_9PEZI|nr:hypothetical protein B0A55_11729 [Friedmanniomyces simplex]TKA63393.1 hypothetical protein B0A55_10472 [Friedmanniomyces simplex]